MTATPTAGVKVQAVAAFAAVKGGSAATGTAPGYAAAAGN
jgi:hypothetical protein